jgi:hypothetical protein
MSGRFSLGTSQSRFGEAWILSQNELPPGRRMSENTSDTKPQLMVGCTSIRVAHIAQRPLLRYSEPVESTLWIPMDPSNDPPEIISISRLTLTLNFTGMRSRTIERRFKLRMDPIEIANRRCPFRIKQEWSPNAKTCIAIGDLKLLNLATRESGSIT